MASLSLVLAAYVLFFALPVVLPKGGYLLLHGVVTGGLLALLLFGGEAGAGGPTRPLSEAVYLLFWLVTLSGVAARRLPPVRDAGKPIQRAVIIVAGLALPPIVLVAMALAG